MPEIPDTLELIPTDEDDFSPDEELAAVVDPDEDESEPITQIPLGTTWLFDFNTGKLALYGTTPVMIGDIDALKMWCHTALTTERFAHPIFGDDFGSSDINGPVGYAHNAERNAEYARNIRETLMVHDRISDVRDFKFTFDEDEGHLLDEATLVLDDESIATLEGIGLA